VIVDQRIWYDARKETKIDTLPSKYQGLIACEEFRDKLWKKGREIATRRKGVLEDRREDCIISEHACDKEVSTSVDRGILLHLDHVKEGDKIPYEFAENDLT
jgi:hypothetical protein